MCVADKKVFGHFCMHAKCNLGLLLLYKHSNTLSLRHWQMFPAQFLIWKTCISCY